ncbi:hypothetical protein C6503_03550 [Candidatus Poribacteria bacterium]|nr:MAG: hypothetical protein C6503_03550 [Candidatus Poribacteria bacterium]
MLAKKFWIPIVLVLKEIESDFQAQLRTIPKWSQFILGKKPVKAQVIINTMSVGFEVLKIELFRS